MIPSGITTPPPAWRRTSVSIQDICNTISILVHQVRIPAIKTSFVVLEPKTAENGNSSVIRSETLTETEQM